MKKLLLILLVILSITSCKEDRSINYKTIFVIYYPGDNDTISIYTNRLVSAYSNNGTSYINNICFPYNEYSYETTAPIKILSINKLY